MVSATDVVTRSPCCTGEAINLPKDSGNDSDDFTSTFGDRSSTTAISDQGNDMNDFCSISDERSNEDALSLQASDGTQSSRMMPDDEDDDKSIGEDMEGLGSDPTFEDCPDTDSELEFEMHRRCRPSLKAADGNSPIAVTPQGAAAQRVAFCLIPVIAQPSPLGPPVASPPRSRLSSRAKPFMPGGNQSEPCSSGCVQFGEDHARGGRMRPAQAPHFGGVAPATDTAAQYQHCPAGWRQFGEDPARGGRMRPAQAPRSDGVAPTTQTASQSEPCPSGWRQFGEDPARVGRMRPAQAPRSDGVAPTTQTAAQAKKTYAESLRQRMVLSAVKRCLCGATAWQDERGNYYNIAAGEEGTEWTCVRRSSWDDLKTEMAFPIRVDLASEIIILGGRGGGTGLEVSFADVCSERGTIQWRQRAQPDSWAKSMHWRQVW